MLLRVLVFACAFVSAALAGPGAAFAAEAASAPAVAPSDPRLRAFVDGVTADINRFWRGSLDDYAAPSVTWYRDTINTDCGPAENDGPFYCPADRVVYLDAALVEILWSKDVKSGIATFIAHEFGHHVQRTAVRPSAQPPSTWG